MFGAMIAALDMNGKCSHHTPPSLHTPTQFLLLVYENLDDVVKIDGSSCDCVWKEVYCNYLLRTYLELALEEVLAQVQVLWLHRI